MTTFGIDYAWGRPGPAALKAAGAKFVCRYFSNDAAKNLSVSEAKSLSAAGIDIVVVWETTAQRALSGRSAGVNDAGQAARQAKQCGMPDGRPIYFAVDWDAAESQQGKINAYLDGAATVLGRNCVGIYGGYWPVKRALDSGHAKWAWQTYAWSGGHWDGRAHIQQYSNGHRLAGVGVDYNHAMKSDFGQWRIGVTPEEDDVSASDVWSFELPKTDDFPESWQAGTHLRHTTVMLGKIAAGQAALAKQAGVEIDEKAVAQAIVAALDVDTLAALIKDGLAADVVDELKSRL